jgi:Fic/DOC family
MAILYLATDTETRRDLQKRYNKGELYRVRNGVYVDTDIQEEVERTILSNWIDIANFLFDDAIAVFRTAAELKPHNHRAYLMVADGERRTVKVGPLKLTIEAGVIDQGVEPFDPKMQRSNVPRQLLENLTLSRAKSGDKKTLGQEWVESQLLLEVERRGEEGLNRLRNEANLLAPNLDMEKEYAILNKMIAAILATLPAQGILQTRSGVAFADGEPFDTVRIERFRQFAAYLEKVELTTLPYQYDSSSWRSLAFFESYYSNYIEGTKFTLDEAEDIISTGEATYERHEDSHDLLSHMEITADQTEMSRVPDNAASLVDLLKVRHSILLAQRSDKRPGEFKEKPNQAGDTLFVLPHMVEGTLVQGYDFYSKLPTGIKRALFIHFLIAECHPFEDGNGRMARIMMNAELVAADHYKIIVPIVCRDNYLDSLRDATRRNRFRTTVKVLHQLHQYTESVDWRYYDDARTTLEEHGANKEPNEGLMIFNKQLRKYTGDYQAL